MGLKNLSLRAIAGAIIGVRKATPPTIEAAKTAGQAVKTASKWTADKAVEGAKGTKKYGQDLLDTIKEASTRDLS